MSSIAVTASASRPRPAGAVLFAIGLTAILTTIAFQTGGGFHLGDTTPLEMALQIGGGAAAALAILAGGGRRAYGATAVALFGALALLTLASITWSVEPSESWIETSRTLAWLSTFVIGAVIARLVSEWWEPLLFALLATAVIVSAYALLTKIAPGALAADEPYARLRQPYSYWNSVGLTAAMGIPICLWLAIRERGNGALSALAYPLTALLGTAVLLSYSRGALLALGLGLVFWFCFCPRRLRTFAVLTLGALGTTLVSLYVFGRDALTLDHVRLDLRTDAGLDFGLALLLMLLLLTAAGLALEFVLARRPPSALLRRRASIAILVVLALVPIAFAAKLTASDRGLTGSVSHTWTTLTDPRATTPSNEPGRLTEVGSVRSRYWNEALKTFGDHVWTGVGAGGYATARVRYRDDSYTVRHAHGYVVQTASDLGVFGLAASLALLVAWMIAAGRTIGLLRRLPGQPPAPPQSWTPERVGMLTLGTIVLTFGLHSLIDWTWFIPGNAIPALLAAGWLAGRGPGPAQIASLQVLYERIRANAREPLRIAEATVILVVALIAAWATWQPLRSSQASDDAVAALDRAVRSRTPLNEAKELAITAHNRDPLSVEPLFELAAIYQAAGRDDLARTTYQDAVKLQPANPATYVSYADFELNDADDPERALQLLRPALYLDPHSSDVNALLQQIALRTDTQLTLPPGFGPAQGAPPAPGA